ncbi:MAG: DUF4037 domain-containing protein [Dehalococcoidia bacterium]|nr:DUF4037 domain-containing protein [Dehalococcoidia bacterium]
MAKIEINGMELARRFYFEAVLPIVVESGIGAHAAGRLDSGSEVIGFDDDVSRDHDWGPRFTLFVPDELPMDHRIRLDTALTERLPRQFAGYLTNFAQPVPEDPGTRLMAEPEGGVIDHRVEIASPVEFFSEYAGLDIGKSPSIGDWLATPAQILLTISTGPVFHDEIGLAEIQRRFEFYPEDVRLYLMASEWSAISEEEPFVGRAGSTGDDVGSALIAARMVQHAMRLCFLIEKRYPPYSKWFGAAFNRLACADVLSPMIRSTLRSSDWRERERSLVELLGSIGDAQNALGIAPPVDPAPRKFFGRDITVLGSDRFAKALVDAIESPEVVKLAGRRLVGGIDTFSDSSDLLNDIDRRAALKSLYR